LGWASISRDDKFVFPPHTWFVCHRVANGETRSLPHPDEDWDAFISTLKTRNSAEGTVWDPLSKTMREWVNMKKLLDTYGGAHVTSSACVVC